MSRMFTDESIAKWLLIGSRECAASAERQRLSGYRDEAMESLRLHIGRRDLGRRILREEASKRDEESDR